VCVHLCFQVTVHVWLNTVHVQQCCLLPTQPLWRRARLVMQAWRLFKQFIRGQGGEHNSTLSISITICASLDLNLACCLTALQRPQNRGDVRGNLKPWWTSVCQLKGCFPLAMRLTFNDAGAACSLSEESRFKASHQTAGESDIRGAIFQAPRKGFTVCSLCILKCFFLVDV
jgi:hypothetical protein